MIREGEYIAQKHIYFHGIKELTPCDWVVQVGVNNRNVFSQPTAEVKEFSAYEQLRKTQVSKCLLQVF